MYDIIAIGDGQFLYQILNFLGLLNSTGIFTKLGMIGGLLGIVFTLLGSIMKNAQDVPVGQIIVGIVLFMVFFGQTASVRVEDFYSGRTRVVDNVPLGTAIVGSMVSGIGVGLAENFMQASAVPGVEELPYNYVLDALMATRDLTDGAAWSTREMAEADRNIQEYVRNCVKPIYRTSGKWPNGTDPTQADDAWEAMRVDSSARTMQDFMGTNGDVPTYITCTAGWLKIEAFFSSSAYANELELSISRHLHRELAVQQSPGNQYSQIFEMIGQQGANGQLALKNAIISNIASRSGAGDELDSNKVASTLLTTTAAQQRNVQFAAETSLWLRMVRGIMTFFEGVAYGMAPFAALLIPFGAYGMRIGLRYVAILLWIFLWIPLLSFVNLFTIDAITGQLDAMQHAAGAPMHSIVGIMNAQYTAADYIGIAGWLAPTVASVAGVLVFGGMAGFNSLAGRVTGADFIKEDQIVPNALQTGALHSQGAGYTASPGEAAMLTNAPAQSWNWRDVASRNTGYKLAESSEAYRTFARELSEAGVKNFGIGTTGTDGTNVTATTRGGTSSSVTSTDGRTASFNQDNGASNSYKAARTEDSVSSAQLEGSAGLGLGKAPVSANVGMSGKGVVSTKNAETHGAEIDNGVTMGQVKSTGISDQEQATRAAELAKALATGTVTAADLGVKGSEGEALKQAASEAWKATQAYEESVGLAQSHSSSMQITENQAAAALANQGRVDDVVAAANNMAGEHFHNRMQAMEHMGADGSPKYANAQHQLAAAAILALGDAANDPSKTPALREAAAGEQAEFLSRAAGGNPGGYDRASAMHTMANDGAGLKSGVHTQTQGVAGEVAPARTLSGPGIDVQALESQAGGFIERVGSHNAAVNAHSNYAGDSANVRNDHTDDRQALTKEAYGATLDKMIDAGSFGNDIRSYYHEALNTAQGWTNATDVTLNGAMVPVAAVFAGARAAEVGLSEGRLTPEMLASPGARAIAAYNTLTGSSPSEVTHGAFGEYTELATYAALSGLNTDVRMASGVTPQAYEAMGMAIAHTFGAETAAATKMLGEIGFETNPAFVSAANFIRDSHRQLGTQ